MPEEIADLTGNRIHDERYANNVVFDKNGLNELLGEIRDYPIIDIDYVAEDETDKINSDRRVWQTYTNDTPCIKIIYGDKTNPNGNLTLEDMKQIRDWQNDIALYNNVHALYDKYSVIEDEYKTLIQNIETELENIIINVCNTYNKYLNSGGVSPTNNTTWAGTYYKMYQDAKEQYPGVDDFAWHIYPGKDGNQGLYYKITFSVIDILSRLDSIINNDNGIDALQFYNIEYGVRGDSPVNPIGPDENGKYYIIPLMIRRSEDESEQDIANIAWTGYDLYDSLYPAGAGTWTITNLDKQFKTYNDLLQQTIEALTYKYVKNTEPFDGAKAYYTYSDEFGYTWEKNLDGFSANTIYYVRKGSDGTDHIRSLLTTYANYIRQARIDQMEAIRQYLVAQRVEDTNNALTTEITQYDMADSAPYKKVYNYVMEKYFEQSIATIEQNIEQKLTNATTDKYVEVPNNAEFDPNTSYYEQDAQGRFIQVNINSTAIFNNYSNTLYTLVDGAIPAIYGYKYVPVGSNITWNDNKVYPISPQSNERNSGTFVYPEVDPDSPQRNGHFRININGHVYEIGIKGLEYSSTTTGRLSVGQDNTTAYLLPADNSTDSRLGTSAHPWTTACINGLKPSEANTGSIGSTTAPYGNAYITTVQPATSGAGSVGTSGTPYGSGYFNSGYFGSITIGTGTGAYTIGPGTGGDNGTQFITTSGPVSTIWVTNTSAGAVDGINESDTSGNLPSGTSSISKNTSASIYTVGGICAEKNVWAKRVFNAVFNDYAEYRKTCEGVKPGQCVYEKDDGSLAITDHFLMPGAQVVSDTFGHIMGGSEECTTPLAVAGRVLVYPYQDRKNYHAGMCVCAAPGGTVNIMSRKDIMEYPDCIVGIVSEIPDYEYWGTDNIKVDGRIWIKVR